MDRKKLIYIGLILILTVIVSITYFSYAFFTHRDEQSGKLNIITGTLNYKIESNDLTNNSITLEAGEVKSIEIELSSLNDINSKYELYYETTNNSIKVGYDTSKDLPVGTINANGKKTLIINLKNYSTTASGTVTFNAEGGFTTNNLVKSRGISIPTSSSLCSYTENQVFNFTYNGTDGTDGSAQVFDTDFCSGNYKVELWGAQGGTTYAENNHGGYVSGKIQLIRNAYLYVYVGAQGSQSRAVSFNGGGYGGNSNFTNHTNTNSYGSSGGGATDIRYFGTANPPTSDLKWDSVSGLNSRIIVAAGGGGSSGYSSYSTAGENSTAGGLSGYAGGYYSGHTYVGQNGKGGTQVDGGAAGVNHFSASGTNTAGTFGIGGNSDSTSDQSGSGGGGGGYYGGGAGGSTKSYGFGQGGGGGSSFISGHAGSVAVLEGSTTNPRTVKTGCTTITANNMFECSKHYSGLYFTNTIMIDGKGYSWTNVKGSLEQMPNPNGGYYASGTGNTGNGYARITYLGE